MTRDLDQDDLEPRPAHQITWFAPDRPVEGQTVYVRPADAVRVDHEPT